LDHEIQSLSDLIKALRSIESARGPVSVDDIFEVVGTRSFGPVLLVAGLVTLAPLIGDIPGVPTLMSSLVILVALQLIVGRQHIWLPKFLRERSIERAKLHKAIGHLERPAAFLDRLFKPRLQVLATPPGSHVVGATALLVAAVMPLLEFIPFSATVAGAALTTFGLSLITRDGYMAVISLMTTAGVIALLGRHVMSL
jgi:hypothetical protein